MRHSQPEAITLVLSGFPDVQGAMSAILLQADEILVKPIEVGRLAELIRKRILEPKLPRAPAKRSVASILEHDTDITIERWLVRVKAVEELAAVSMDDGERTAHLRAMTRDICARLRGHPVVEALDRPCQAAVAHGQFRYRQGYTAPMMVRESRILQVCVFETIQRNLASVDFSLVLPDVMTIADEIDSQLTQSVGSYLDMQRNAEKLDA